MQRLPWSKTASSQRLPRKSTSRLRPVSKLMKPSPFLERTLALWRALAINHRVVKSALPSLDKRIQRRGEWRVRHLARGYLELPCVRNAKELERQGKVAGFSQNFTR